VHFFSPIIFLFFLPLFTFIWLYLPLLTLIGEAPEREFGGVFHPFFCSAGPADRAGPEAMPFYGYASHRWYLTIVSNFCQPPFLGNADYVAMASTPASLGGVPPRVGGERTGTVRKLAAGDGCATRPAATKANIEIEQEAAGHGEKKSGNSVSC
jgi:hypothetical protein